MWITDIVLIVLLIVVNGFFSASEIALISLRKSRVRHLVKSGNLRAKKVQRLQEEPERFLGTVQIGVTLVGTLASTLGGVIAIERIKPVLSEIPIDFIQKAAEPIAVVLIVSAITYLTLVVGELVPKSLALRYSEPIAFWASGIGSARSAVTHIPSSPSRTDGFQQFCSAFFQHRRSSGIPLDI
jgi:putative hemolysin